MKVLFVTRAHIGLGKGGLERKIRLTAGHLRRRGVEVIYYDPWRNQLGDVDICHCFSAYAQMYYHVIEAKKRGKPVVMSPVFGRYDVPLWQIALKVRLSKYIPGLYTDYVLLKKILTLSDRVLPLVEEEGHRLAKSFGIPINRITIVPNGVDRRFGEGNPALFQERYGISNFVLQVGSIDPNKNQLTIIKAMADLPYTYVVIGEPLLGCEPYMEKCRAAAGKNVLFINQLDYDGPMLKSAYAAAKVFIMPSYSETWGQTLYQAAQAGCSVIVSKNIPISPYIRDYVSQANPKSPKQFRTLIEKAMDSEATEKLRQAALSMPTWADVGRQIIGIYEEVLTKRRG